MQKGQVQGQGVHTLNGFSSRPDSSACPGLFRVHLELTIESIKDIEKGINKGTIKSAYIPTIANFGGPQKLWEKVAGDNSALGIINYYRGQNVGPGSKTYYGDVVAEEPIKVLISYLRQNGKLLYGGIYANLAANVTKRVDEKIIERGLQISPIRKKRQPPYVVSDAHTPMQIDGDNVNGVPRVSNRSTSNGYGLPQSSSNAYSTTQTTKKRLSNSVGEPSKRFCRGIPPEFADAAKKVEQLKNESLEASKKMNQLLREQSHEIQQSKGTELQISNLQEQISYMQEQLKEAKEQLKESREQLKKAQERSNNLGNLAEEKRIIADKKELEYKKALEDMGTLVDEARGHS